MGDPTNTESEVFQQAVTPVNDHGEDAPTLVTKADGSVASEALNSTASLVDLLDQAEVTELDPNTHKFRAAAAGERALTPEEVSELLGDVGSQRKAYEDAFGGTGAPGVRVELPGDHPFWGHPKIVVTPHIAAFSAPETVVELVVANIERIERGEPPLYAVDFDRGY